MRADRRRAWILSASLVALIAAGGGAGVVRWGATHAESCMDELNPDSMPRLCEAWLAIAPLADRLVSPTYRTPSGLWACGDGSLLVVARDANQLLVVDTLGGGPVRKIDVGRRPHSVAADPNCRRAWVSNEDDDTVSIVDLGAGLSSYATAATTLAVGHAPADLAISGDESRLFVANRLANEVSVLALPSGREEARLASGRDPAWMAVAPDGRTLLVASERAAPARWPGKPVTEVTRIDTRDMRVLARHRLVDAHLLGDPAFVPGLDRALVPLVRPKNLVPVLQEERGWMMTNGFAILDAAWEQIPQLPLDDRDHMYADPAAVVVTPDGSLAFVSHAGSDTVSVIDLAAVDALLSETAPSTWEELANRLDLSPRYVRARIETGRTPTALAASPDGRWIYVAESLDDRIGVIDVARLQRVASVDLEGPGWITMARLGEYYFHGAGEFSCRSCHPRAGTDGLQYDFESGGLGRDVVDNRSLLGLSGTQPFKWTGRSPTLNEHCGVRFEHFLSRHNSFLPYQAEALLAWLYSLAPPLPRRAQTPPSAAEERGRALFERSVTSRGEPIPAPRRCTTCHSGPRHSNSATVNVGTGSLFDSDAAFDVPHLTGLADTAPYLHDGRALLLEEIWARFNPDDRHGVTSDLDPDAIRDLASFLRRL